MDWLKKILGESYNKLSNEDVAKFGNIEYIPNDPTKIVPKNVFNEKIEKIKLLETQKEQYETRLNQVGDMVTSNEMKTQLETQKIEFENTIKQQEKDFNTKIDTMTKTNLMRNALIEQGLKPNYVEMALNQLKPDDAIISDGKLLNSEKLILPLKEKCKEIFDVKLTGNTPPANNGTPPAQPTTRQELINKYNEAEKNNNFVKMQQLQREIKSIQED